MRIALLAGLCLTSSVFAGEAEERARMGFPAGPLAAPLQDQLTGPGGKGVWSLNGNCRRPELTFTRGTMGLTVRFSQQDEDGSRGSFSSARIDGDAAKFTLKFSQMMPGTTQMEQTVYSGAIAGARLTLTDSEGARRVYRRCDGDAPARNWEME